jgi:hypothetical protein
MIFSGHREKLAIKFDFLNIESVIIRYKCGQCLVAVMTDSMEEPSIPDSKLKRIRERVLQAEKEKLNLDNPRGIINDIEQIIEEEIN